MLIRDELIREKTVKPPAALIVTPSPLNHQSHHLLSIQFHDSWFPVTVSDRGSAYGAYTIFVTMDSNYAISLSESVYSDTIIIVLSSVSEGTA